MVDSDLEGDLTIVKALVVLCDPVNVLLEYPHPLCLFSGGRIGLTVLSLSNSDGRVSNNSSFVG